MSRFSPAVLGIAAVLLGSSVAVAQTIAPAYRLQREFFHVAPSVMPGGKEDLEAPDQEVPGFVGQTHVPSNSVQGRGSDRVQLQIIDR